MTNAVLGLMLFEWAWWRMRHYRKPIKELNDLLPAFRRDDAVRWSKWKFYPGAVTIMLPRFFFGVGLGMFLSIFLFFALIGQPMDKPISGLRSMIIRWAYKFSTFWFQLITNFNIVTWKKLTPQEVNYYEEWLGPREEQEKEQFSDTTMINERRLVENGSTDFSEPDPRSFAQSPTSCGNALYGRRVPKRGRGPASTIICNHIGWVDVMGLIMSPLHPGFTPKTDFINTPILGTACRGLQSLFVDRGSDKASKDKVVEQIV